MFVLALLIHPAFNVMEVLWTFPLYLEALAILPQLVLLQRSSNIDNLTGNYIFILGYEAVCSYLFVLWTFPLYLEALAILPQLVLLQRSSNIDNLTGNYIFILGGYRALYLINWVYRFFMENHKFHWIPWLSVLVQTALYANFFYYYIKSWKNHEKLKLPA
ncbi:hypothetical protein CRYUN_Cryun05aG0060800 [Craigia yunnanensis]